MRYFFRSLQACFILFFASCSTSETRVSIELVSSSFLQVGTLKIYDWTHVDQNNQLLELKINKDSKLELNNNILRNKPLLIVLDHAIYEDPISRQRIPIKEKNKWYSVLPPSNESQIKFQINPITSLSYQLAEYLYHHTQLSINDAISLSNRDFSKHLGVDSIQTTIPTLDLNDTLSRNTFYGLSLVGLSQMLNNLNTEYALSWNMNDLLSCLSNDLKDGFFDGQSNTSQLVYQQFSPTESLFTKRLIASIQTFYDDYASIQDQKGLQLLFSSILDENKYFLKSGTLASKSVTMDIIKPLTRVLLQEEDFILEFQANLPFQSIDCFIGLSDGTTIYLPNNSTNHSTYTSNWDSESISDQVISLHCKVTDELKMQHKFSSQGFYEIRNNILQNTTYLTLPNQIGTSTNIHTYIQDTDNDGYKEIGVLRSVQHSYSWNGIGLTSWIDYPHTGYTFQFNYQTMDHIRSLNWFTDMSNIISGNIGGPNGNYALTSRSLELANNAVLCDMSADGNPSLFWGRNNKIIRANSYQDIQGIWGNNSTVFVSPPSPHNAYGQDLLCIDINQDGFNDLISNGFVHYGNPNNTFTPTDFNSVFFHYASIKAIGDYNSNGTNDFVVRIEINKRYKNS
ncbi:MAG: hypothetical protein R3A45_03950 [Bdellovibrionota bacterium]